MTDLDLLMLLSIATALRKVVWRHIGEDRYEAIDKTPYIIEYQHPLLPDGRTSDVALIYVTMAGIVIGCVESSPEGRVVEKILTLAIPEWTEGKPIMEKNRAEAARTLMSLMDEEQKDL